MPANPTPPRPVSETPSCYACGHDLGVCSEGGCSACHCGGFMATPLQSSEDGVCLDHGIFLCEMCRPVLSRPQGPEIRAKVRAIVNAAMNSLGEYDTDALTDEVMALFGQRPEGRGDADQIAGESRFPDDGVSDPVEALRQANDLIGELKREIDHTALELAALRASLPSGRGDVSEETVEWLRECRDAYSPSSDIRAIYDELLAAVEGR